MTTDTALPTLLAEIRSCTLCAAELPSGPRPVVRASTSARILVAGQAPGRRVHESGIPFDDPSGDRLRDWLGIDRATFYDEQQLAIVPMGFCYPGTGTSGDLPPRPECAATWHPRLLTLLPNLQLTLVIGQYALAYHLPDASRGRTLTAVVQDWREHWPTVVPLPHPSPRNNRWLKLNPWFTTDLLPELQARVADVLTK